MTVSFRYDKNRAIQVIRWFLHHHEEPLSRLKLVKLVFFADRRHLQLYGRPVVGGKYFALPHGPVSSPLLDALKEVARNPECAEEYGIAGRGRYDLVLTATVDEEFLSQSDREVLEEIDAEYGAMSASELRNLTHKLKAYKKNAPPKGGSRPLPYLDFFDDLDDKSIIPYVLDMQGARDFFE